MCDSCWKRYGSPNVDSPNSRRAEELIRIIYDHSPVGVPFHVELDDWNLRTGPLEPYWGDDESEYEAEHVEAAKALSALTAKMSVEELASALARCDGYAPALSDEGQSNG
jgi:hypothetical protein